MPIVALTALPKVFIATGGAVAFAKAYGFTIAYSTFLLSIWIKHLKGTY